ncbi:unnamed protein product [Ectocarpus sp. 6 AP-2014]
MLYSSTLLASPKMKRRDSTHHAAPTIMERNASRNTTTMSFQRLAASTWKGKRKLRKASHWWVVSQCW